MKHSTLFIGCQLLACLVLACLAPCLTGCGEKPEPTASVPSVSENEPDLPDNEPDLPDNEPAADRTAPAKTPETANKEVPRNESDLANQSDISEPAEVDSASLHLSGLHALQAGETDAAYQYARQAMQQDAENPQIIFLMAMVLAERHRFAEAIEMLDEVAEKTPEAKLPALGHTADWLVRFGKWEEAEARYRQILEQLPEAVLAHRNLASLLMRQGRRLEAHRHLERLCYLGDITENELRSMLITLHPFAGDVEEDSYEPIGALGFARVEIAREDWQGGRERLQQSGSAGAWESALIGRTHAVLDDLPRLRAWVAASDDSVNKSPDAWFAKGVYAASGDNPADATRCFAEAVRLDPTDVEAYREFARVLSETGATAEAEAAERRAEAIEKTQELGSEMAASEERDQENIALLSNLLKQLQRPLESLGWQGVWLTYADATGAISESELQQSLKEVSQERTRLLNESQTQASTDFVLCGLDLATLPSLAEVDERLKRSAVEAAP